MAEETTIVARWLVGVLSADTSGAGSLGVLSSGITGRIYDTVVVQSQDTFPVIVFQLQAAGDDMATNGARRIYSNLLFAVKVIGKDQAFSVLSPLVKRVDDLIHRVSNALPTGGRVIACTRERPLKYAENDSGIIYRHLGGIYRVLAREE